MDEVVWAIVNGHVDDCCVGYSLESRDFTYIFSICAMIIDEARYRGQIDEDQAKRVLWEVHSNIGGK